MDKNKILQELSLHLQELRKKYSIKKIGLFGSYTKDTFDNESDIDIVVVFEEGKATFSNVSGLVEFLENLFGKEIDLLTPQGIESIRIKSIREQIKREVIYV